MPDNLQPLARSIDRAVADSGMCRTLVYRAIKEGRLRAVKYGRKTLILDEDFRAFLHSLPAKELA